MAICLPAITNRRTSRPTLKTLNISSSRAALRGLLRRTQTRATSTGNRQTSLCLGSLRRVRRVIDNFAAIPLFSGVPHLRTYCAIALGEHTFAITSRNYGRKSDDLVYMEAIGRLGIGNPSRPRELLPNYYFLPSLSSSRSSSFYTPAPPLGRYGLSRAFVQEDRVGGLAAYLS